MCAAGAGIELIWQMLVDGKSLACVNWSSVATEALGGCAGGMGAGKLAKLLKKVFGCNSFTAETLVHTENGLKPISEIKVGDKVLSYDERTETTSDQPVMTVIQGEKPYQIIKITLDSGESIEATAEHPFYIKGKGWNPASSLKVGQALQLHNGTTVVVKEIDTSVRLEKVYNLTVANTHNYFVGGDGVLVHNCILGDIRKKLRKFESILSLLSILAEEGDAARGRNMDDNSRKKGEQHAEENTHKKKKKGSGDGNNNRKEEWGRHNSHNKNKSPGPPKRRKFPIPW